MNTFKLNIASPNGNIFSGDAERIMLRGTDGDLAVLAGHIPFTTTVVPCDFYFILPDGTRKNGKLKGGLLTVSNKEVTLLSGNATIEE